jgi:DNA modification methylase
MTFEVVHVGPHTLYRGRCEDVLPTLADKSVDMVFTDPPYGHNNNNNGDLISRWEAALGRGDYQPERDNRPIANDGGEAHGVFCAMLVHAERLLSPGCCCCCCCCGGGPDPMFARWSLALDEIFDFKQMVVWDKGPMGMGWHYRRSYETVLVAMKRGAACRWYDDSHEVENIIRPSSGIRKIIPSAAQHPCEKPVELAAHFIRLHSQPGDMILDPFGGAFTTGVAAQQMGRRFIGIELSLEWFDIACRRIEDAHTGGSLLKTMLPDKDLFTP